MAQSSEIKLNKRFDQNIEITGTLTVGGSEIDFSSFLTSFTETDPTVPSHVKLITTTNVSNWNTAYGWGNHADAGYLTSYTETDTLATVTARGASTGEAVSFSSTGLHLSGHWFNSFYSGTTNYIHLYPNGHTGGASVTNIRTWNGTSYDELRITGGDDNIVWRNNNLIHSGNIGSQSVSYAGSAGSALTAGSSDSSGYSSSLYRYDNRIISPSEYPAGRMTFGFTSFNNNNTAPWADFIHLRGYTDNSGGADNMLVFSKSDLAMRLYQQTYGSSSAYSTYVDVITSGNIGSYAPGLNGSYNSDWYANAVYYDDWLRNHSNTNGLYWSTTGWHLHPYNSNDFTLRSGSSVESTIRFANSGNTTWGYIHCDANKTTGFLNDSRSWVSYTTSSGNHYATGSSRAPIFYDSNDTNYYTDPNGGSVLNNLNVKGYIHVSTNNTTGNGIIIADDGDIVDLNDAYLSMRFSYGVRIYSANRGGSVRHTLHSDGNAYFNTSARSPIFYDNNDTNYYIDPNSTSNLNAANFGKIGGFKAAAFSDFYVYGDQNTYYPVIIGGGAHFGFHEYSISRGYSWTAPWDPIGTGSHKGGLTFNFYWSGDTAWGGNDHHIRVKHFSEQYTTMVAGLALPVTGGICVWLRGGGSGGAQYRLHAPGGHNHTPTVYDGASMSGHSTSTTFTAANGATFSPRTDTSNVNGEINARWPVRGNNEVVAGNLYCGYANFSGTSDLRKTNIVASGSGWYDGLNLISVDGSNTWNLLVDNGAADMFRVAYNSSEKFRIQTNGEVYTIGTGLAGSDYRAPIFYDSNNTGYYLDPASNSYLYGLFIGDNAGSNQKIDIRYGNYNTGYGAIRFHQAGSNNQTIHAFSTSWQGGSFPSASAGAINITGANGVTFGGWNNPDAWIDTSGNISARVAMFANTYYDRNNTNYYLNPDGGSNINTLDTGDTLINHTRGGKIGFTASGNASDGFPYARIGEAWGVNMSPPDPRWAPSVTNASFLVGSISGGANYGIGNIRATGDIIAYASDKRLKRNIKPITNALNKVINMNGVYYDWDLELCNKFDFYPPEKTEAGVLAQEVKEVFPEVVQQAPFDCDADENGNVISKSGETYLTVKYEKLVPLLIEAVKELSNKVEDLENQLKQKS